MWYSYGFPLLIIIRCHFIVGMGDGVKQHAVLSVLSFFFLSFFVFLFCFRQRNFSMSVNSAAVLRLTGRGGGGTVVGAPRGRSSSRGRGELPCGKCDNGGRGERNHFKHILILDF